jgi:hypothetical protein
MSNPLIKPNDPRFVRPPLTDQEGKNRFADADVVHAASADGAAGTAPAASRQDNLFAPPQVTPIEEGPTYALQYVTTQSHRGVLLLVLALVALAGDAAAATAIGGYFLLATLGLAAIVPAAAAWMMSAADLRGMRQGAIDRGGELLTRIALWLGVAGVVGWLGAIALNVVLFLMWIAPLVGQD